MKKWSFFIINILVANVILACNFGTSHPILWHYNQTDEVFIGKVIKIGNVETMDFAYVEKSTNIPTYKVRLVVQKTYKSLLKDTIDIGKIALAKIDFILGESYLIYGDYIKNDGFLVTGNILNVTDARMKKHDLLTEIASPVAEADKIVKFWTNIQTSVTELICIFTALINNIYRLI